MNVEERTEFIIKFFEEKCIPVLDKEGSDYSAVDANSTFQDVADCTSKADKYDVWYIYFAKHLKALEKYIKTRKLESEGLESRITDLINYLFIFLSMQSIDDIHHGLIMSKDDKLYVERNKVSSVLAGIVKDPDDECNDGKYYVNWPKDPKDGV